MDTKDLFMKNLDNGCHAQFPKPIKKEKKLNYPKIASDFSKKYKKDNPNWEKESKKVYKFKRFSIRKTKKSTLKNKADRLFSEMIRSVGVCLLEGDDGIKCGGVLQCAHIIGRANHRLRWDKMNALCICAGHHTFYTNHPWEWQEMIKKDFYGSYKYINKHRNEIWDKDINKVLEALNG